MAAVMQELLDKVDTFELVRDKVALILAEESAGQQALATEAGRNPDEWKLRVFLERTNPWETWRTDSGTPPADRSPLVSVWYETSNTDSRASQNTNRQQMEMTVNVDVYGCGVTSVGSESHTPGDKTAALEAQRGARLARNILMSGYYRYLGFDRSLGLIGDRTVQNIESFQPEFANLNAVHVQGVRLSLRVKIAEYAPEYTPVPLELINAVVTDDDGELLLDVTYESTS